MTDSERVSLGTQITRCYSTNRAAKFRLHLGVCSFDGKLRERFDSKLEHYRGWKGVHFVESDFVETARELAGDWMRDGKYGGRLAGIFSASSSDSKDSKYSKDDRAEDDAETYGETEENGETTIHNAPETHNGTEKPSEIENAERIATLQSQAEIVYLSSEATETLHTLKPYSTYIIGGLVDKNREKGVCHARATERGVKTAKLPIGEFLDLTSRRVLATNHVFEIMLKSCEDGDWGRAFMGVIPKRKGGKLRTVRMGMGDGEGIGEGGGEENDDNDEDDGSEDGIEDESVE